MVDADPIVAGIWAYLIAAKETEILALPDMPDVGDSVDNYIIPQEAKWLIGFWLNRGSAQPKKCRTAYSARNDRAQLNWGSRAKERIASGLSGIRDWKVVHGDYSQARNVCCMWFVDPPYGDKGKFYRVGFNQFGKLGPWCMERSGQLIVCEGPGADWLNFSPIGSFKSTKGRADEYAFLRAA